MFKRIVRWFKVRFCINYAMREAIEVRAEPVRKQVEAPTVTERMHHMLVGAHIEHTINPVSGVISVKIGGNCYQYLPAQFAVKHLQRKFKCSPAQFVHSMCAKWHKNKISEAHKSDAIASFNEALAGRERKKTPKEYKFDGVPESVKDKCIKACRHLDNQGIPHTVDRTNGTISVKTKFGILKYYPSKGTYQLNNRRVSNGGIGGFVQYQKWIMRQPTRSYCNPNRRN